MKEARVAELEQLLRERGWTSPEQEEIHVYREYRPHKAKPWEFTVYSKWPIWKWDIVQYNGKGYSDYSPSNGEWVRNMRSDFEFENIDDLTKVADEMTAQLEDDMDNCPLAYQHTPWPEAVQRVSNRPNA